MLITLSNKEQLAFHNQNNYVSLNYSYKQIIYLQIHLSGGTRKLYSNRDPGVYHAFCKKKLKAPCAVVYLMLKRGLYNLRVNVYLVNLAGESVCIAGVLQ